MALLFGVLKHFASQIFVVFLTLLSSHELYSSHFSRRGAKTQTISARQVSLDPGKKTMMSFKKLLNAGNSCDT